MRVKREKRVKIEKARKKCFFNSKSIGFKRQQFRTKIRRNV